MEIHKGLEGVVVDTTAVSLVDGARGELSYRGYEIGELVHRPFADVAALVATGAFDGGFGCKLVEHGTLSGQRVTILEVGGARPRHSIAGRCIRIPARSSRQCPYPTRAWPVAGWTLDSGMTCPRP